MNDIDIFSSKSKDFSQSYSANFMFSGDDMLFSESEKRYIREIVGSMLTEALVAAGIIEKD